MEIASQIEALYDSGERPAPRRFEDLFAQFLSLLNEGKIRAAEPSSDGWRINGWVKKGILLGFRYGYLQEYNYGSGMTFLDKHTLPLKKFSLREEVRIVPGGSSVRDGSYLAKGVVVMPPSYINIGAYIDSETMIDSHVLIGSCAQIGRRVHVSAGVQIGGVLEPIGSMPVIIEDDVFIGGNCGIFEGTQVSRAAVIGAGTVLTRTVPVYDMINQCILRGSEQQPLVIPSGAVVIAGCRPIENNPWAKQQKLSAQCALIIKYRDKKTDQSTLLERILREDGISNG